MSPEDENEKIKWIFVYGSVGRNALLYDRNYFQRIFSLVDVFCWAESVLYFSHNKGYGRSGERPLWKQVLWCTAFVVSAEFITGIIVNKVMGWNVWNYTDQPFHLMGQICFPFAVLFSGLCTFGIIISGYLLCYLYREIKPGFHIL